MNSIRMTGGINQDDMKAQLLMLKDAIKTSDMGILKVINVRTIAYVRSENLLFKECCVQLD